VLRYLVAHVGQVATQDALLDAVWGSTAVSETVVRNSIRELRTTLGDPAQHPQFIQTVHRRGYRFIAPVTVADTPQPVLPPATEAPLGAPLSTSPESGAAASSGAEPSLHEEHKLVTVLCCTVTDAPALAVHRGPEAMHRLMQEFLAVAQEVMQRYNGIITHVTGEGFTAVFGAPVGQEDHARCAVLAALELARRLRVQPLGKAHAAAMGLHTGPVVVGGLAYAPQRLYTAVGATIHQALLVQRLAPPGTILLSTATHRLVQAEVRVAVFDPLALDGSGGPLSVYTVQGLTQRRAGVVGQGSRHRSRFVGRERELAILHARLTQAAQGHGQVVGIVGEPGMGKSRFLTEFHRSLVGQHMTYREGHCLPYSSTTPYLPVRDLCRQGCGITEADELEVITAKEVVYRSLLHERQCTLHTRIVEMLETLYHERMTEQVERLAHHALRGEVWDKAVTYCWQAGEKAMARSAHREAVAYYEQALSALQHLPAQRGTHEQAIDLQLALRTALFPLGHFRRILAVLREAEALAVALDDPRRLGQVALSLSNHCYFMGTYDQAITAAQRALALATAHGEVILQARANQFLGVAYQAQGDYPRAIDCFGQAVASLDETQHHERFGEVFPPAVVSRAWLTACHAELGTFVEGRALGEEGLRIAEAIAHSPSALRRPL